MYIHNIPLCVYIYSKRKVTHFSFILEGKDKVREPRLCFRGLCPRKNFRYD